jgi:hypothetical protein
LASANDSASQLFEQSTEIFPESTEKQPFIDYTKKKHPGYAQKSTDGNPSYYAEVGPRGVVAFIPSAPQQKQNE